MKTKIFLLVGLSVGFLAVGALLVRAQTSGGGESITKYAVSLNLEQSGVLHVSEDITYDFGSNQKHGIYRTIPLYPDGWAPLGVSAIGVVSPVDNSTYPFTTSESSGDLNIKIGNPNVLVAGTKEYAITYDVTGAVRSFSDHDELYWNAIGTEWAVPIGQASAAITLPAGVPIGATSTYCYVGAGGSNAQGCTVNIGPAGAIGVDVSNSLPPYQGLTVSVSMPKGYIANTVQPASGSTAGNYASNDIFSVGLVALPIILIFALVVISVIRVIRGLKKRAVIPAELKHVPIAPYYSVPDNLPPSQVGYLENRIFDASDFTAIILDLAVRGFLKIKYIPKESVFGRDDYELSALKPYDDKLPPEYRPIYDLFFGDGGTVTRVNSIERYIGAAKLKEAGSSVTKGFDDAGCLIKPKIGMVGKAAVVFFLGAVASLYLFHDAFFVFAPLMVIFIFIAAGQYKQKFTPKGIELMRKVLGFKMFLTLTETDRLKLMDAPKTSQDSFEAILPEAILPYAIALGVEKEWAKQFESMTIQPPRWIDDSRYRTGFNAGMFVASFSSFTSAMQSSTAMPGSGGGGGGGVGGGGGGGGGGSW